jgi:hypothetical protein
MCDERERLIGYVYDECAVEERREIEAHVASCHVCRQEIGALRKVRQDLLAWHVPETEPVWRPLVPERPKSFWEAVPAWAMAVAASALLAVGAAGGAVTYALLPHAPASPVVAAAPHADPEVAAMVQRLAALEKTQAELTRALTERTAPDVSQVVATQNTLARQVQQIAQRQEDMDWRLTRTTVNTFTNEQRQRAMIGLSRINDSFVAAPEIGVGR